jgi:hypothetical protein
MVEIPQPSWWQLLLCKRFGHRWMDYPGREDRRNKTGTHMELCPRCHAVRATYNDIHY